MYRALLQVDAAGRDLTALRLGICSGAQISGEVICALEQKFPSLVILQGYGLSETASINTVNVNAEHDKVLSVGKPIWGVQARVVGEDGKELSPIFDFWTCSRGGEEGNACTPPLRKHELPVNGG
jgi:long-chain acyl-CoA synthetase